MPRRLSPERKLPTVSRERQFAASLIGDTRGLVVEVGTGSCPCMAAALASSGLRVLAVDWDAAAAAEARRVLGMAGLLGRVAVVQADAARLPFRPCSIHTVVAYSALHHASDLRGAVAGIAAVLHPKGRLIVSDWDEAGNGFLGRLVQALRARFGKVTMIPRSVRRVYVCEKPWQVTPGTGRASVRHCADCVL